MTTSSELAARQSVASTEGCGGSDMKAHTLLLSEEEKKMLIEEGISLPTDMPLTKVSYYRSLHHTPTIIALRTVHDRNNYSTTYST